MSGTLFDGNISAQKLIDTLQHYVDHHGDRPIEIIEVDDEYERRDPIEYKIVRVKEDGGEIVIQIKGSLIRENEEFKEDIDRLTGDAILYELAAKVAYDLDDIFSVNTHRGREMIRKSLRESIDDRHD